MQRTCTVDLKRAHAWHGDECLEGGVCRDVAAGRVAACSNDRELVLAHVRREISFEAVNQRVIAHCESSCWLRRVLRSQPRQMPTSARAAACSSISRACLMTAAG